MKEFVQAINSQEIYPRVIFSKDTDAIAQLELDPENIIISNIDNRQEALLDWAKRFNPQISEIDTAMLKSTYMAQFESMRISLQDGVIGYFPYGYTCEDKLMWEKINYLPREFHYQLMQASSWKMIPQSVRQEIAKIRVYAVGLSVGAQMLSAMSRLGVNKFVIGDPARLHPTMQERYVWYQERFVDWNKTAIAAWELLKYNPYAEITSFYDGLTTQNAPEFFYGLDDADTIPILVEEADSAKAKQLARMASRKVLKDGPLTLMIADVGTTQLVVTLDKPGELPFSGRLAAIDPEGDIYGYNLSNLEVLFGAINGSSSIPNDSPLMPILESGLIGKEIKTVPQAAGAVLAAGAMTYELLYLIAAGRLNEINSLTPISFSNFLLEK